MKLNLQIKPFNKWLFIILAVVYISIFILLKLNLIDVIKMYSELTAIGFISLCKVTYTWLSNLSYIVWYFIIWVAYVIFTIIRYKYKREKENK